MESSISKSIVFSYLSGSATPIEIRQVDEWLKKPDNFELFCIYLLDWERKYAQFTPDYEKAIEKFRLRLEHPETESGDGVDSTVTGQKPARPSRSFRNMLSVAACLLLVATGGWFLREDILYKTLKTPYGEVSRYVLPDGSHVSLNANSSLRLARFGFARNTREVWLDGEAEFSVTHTENDQRFLVKTSRDFQVEVLGTEFSVFTRARGAKVVLNKGKIRIDYRKEGQAAQLTMKPGDLLTVDQAGQMQLQTTKNPEEHSAWKESRFVFDGTSVGEICQLLEDNFGMIVRPSTREIAERTISGNFETHTSDELLDILRELLYLETRVHKDTLLLYQR